MWPIWSISRGRPGGTRELSPSTATSTPSGAPGDLPAITINLLNPKLTIFFFAFLPQFVPANAPNSLQHMLGLSVVFEVMTFAVFAVHGLLAAATRERFLRNPRWLATLRRVFAASFLVLNGRLALESR